MKKFKLLFVLLLAILAVPFMTWAEDEEVTEDEAVEVSEASEDAGETTDAVDENKVKVYFFRGEGCSHCQEASDWFNSIQEEYGSLFEIVDYETWYNEDNNEIKDKVAESRGEEADGVPYIIIGNKSWNGFTDSYKDEMIAEIQSEHDKPVAERYDALKNLDGKGSSKKSKKDESTGDIVSLLVILLATGGVCFGVYKARINTN